jgi:hypothetical protein
MVANSEPMKASSTGKPVALNAEIKTAAASEQTLQRLVCMPCNWQASDASDAESGVDDEELIDEGFVCPCCARR